MLIVMVSLRRISEWGQGFIGSTSEPSLRAFLLTTHHSDLEFNPKRESDWKYLPPQIYFSSPPTIILSKAKTFRPIASSLFNWGSGGCHNMKKLPYDTQFFKVLTNPSSAYILGWV